MQIKQVNPSVLLKNGEKKIETLSGYEFTKIKAKVSYRSVQTFFDFTKEEVSKFVELSKQVEKTNDLDKSIKKFGEMYQIQMRLI